MAELAAARGAVLEVSLPEPTEDSPGPVEPCAPAGLAAPRRARRRTLPELPLEEEVARLVARYERLWLETSAHPPGAAELGPAVGLRAKWRCRRRADRLVRRVCREVRRAPEEPAARARWERRLKARICDFGERCLGWPPSFRGAPLAEEIFAATLEFVRRARELGERSGLELAPGDLFQALRNVWIMNGLQVLLGRPVAATPAVFAYSMLYPLTDNLLDDPAVPTAAKAAFNRRLGRRLAGGRPAAEDARERTVFDLVGEIEGEFPRERHPRVFESLQAIHRGQVRSLGQQTVAVGRPGGEAGPGEGPAAGGDAPGAAAASMPAVPDEALLAVSAEKGGTSVLADGFLIAGDLSPEEADWLFGYGVVLQLSDDLQDATEDRAAGNRTLFSVAAGRRPLNQLASRLARLTAEVLRAAGRFDAPGWPLVVELIGRSCPLLQLQAVAEQRALFTPAYVRRLERHFPVRFAALPALRRRAQRRWAKAEKVLLRHRGAESLAELWQQAPPPGTSTPVPRSPDGGSRSAPPR
jgi:hypothetical protein